MNKSPLVFFVNAIESMTTLVTGAAGFIGYHLVNRLLHQGKEVIGIDNLNDYYSVELKRDRLKSLDAFATINKKSFAFINASIDNASEMADIFKKYKPTEVVNLAAQAGVRHSIENPSSYIQSNLVGFSNILEQCRHHQVKHLVYASSSSVYGGNHILPFSESQPVDHPLSLYAATKKSNELLAHSYSHLYGLPSTGLRFFTVYGPWGRPDMALFLFTKAIVSGEPIKLFNNGEMVRDFTYIDDIIESIVRILDKPPSSNPDHSGELGDSWAPYKIFNIGNSTPIPLGKYINAIEDALGMKATKEFFPMQAGDVQITSAEITKLTDWIQFKPVTPVELGVKKFTDWYLSYYCA